MAVSTMFDISDYGGLLIVKPRVNQKKIVHGEPAACHQGVYVPFQLESVLNHSSAGPRRHS